MEPSTDAARRLRAAEEALPSFLQRQRWFAGKGAAIDSVAIVDVAALGEAAGATLVAVRGSASDERYFVPLASVSAERATRAGATATLEAGSRDAGGSQLIDGALDDAAMRALASWIRNGEAIATQRGASFVPERTPALDDFESSLEGEVRRMNVEQSNTSVVLGDAVVLKLYRHVHSGPQPELEIARFLSAAGFANTPALLGAIEYRASDGARTACAIAQAFVRSDGDAWSTILTHLVAALRTPSEDENGALLDRLDRIGARTAEMHQAFATSLGDPAFEPEPITGDDVATWSDRARASASDAFAALEASHRDLDPLTRARARALLEHRRNLDLRLATAFDAASMGRKTRYHGDYHLGQLLAIGNDVTIVDFEGEPGRGLVERRKKSSPLRDVAGMLRSLDYVASAAERALVAETAGASATASLDVAERARAWTLRASETFLGAYRRELGSDSLVIPTDAPTFAGVLDLFVVEKACYELSYELANRPQWVDIPLGGLERIVANVARGEA